MRSYLITNATIINEGQIFKANLLTENNRIKYISKENIKATENCTIINAEGKFLIPGVIDDHVHFREPGLTHKADIYTESRAAAVGGTTSFMEMPNTIPQVTNIDELENKFNLGEEKSLINYSFYFGATNDNLSEIKKLDPTNVCGLKVFMGSSTGDMLVNNIKSLEEIFSESPVLIATHCEDETTIQNNLSLYREKYGDNLPFHFHSEIRSAEACFLSSSLAVNLAKKYNTRLHILHVSTEKELSLLRNDIPSAQKKITAEVCIHHLWFNESFYKTKESFMKWNPSIKKSSDQKALIEAVNNNKIDVIATDHAPHTIEEKQNSYFKAPSGGPMVQHSLLSMFEFVTKGILKAEKVIEKMCHNPADIFNIKNRGYLREGYYADMVIIDPNQNWVVEKDNILYKCGWSPMEGVTYSHKIDKTFVNGKIVYDQGNIIEASSAMKLQFKN